MYPKCCDVDGMKWWRHSRETMMMMMSYEISTLQQADDDYEDYEDDEDDD